MVTFYVNSHQVGEVGSPSFLPVPLLLLHLLWEHRQIRNLTPFMDYSPFVVFGNGQFEVGAPPQPYLCSVPSCQSARWQVSINRVPEIGKIFNV